MRATWTRHVVIAENVLLDRRLALFHRRQLWLAAADLHFGYELSQRAAGNLFPLWGMQTIEARLFDLLRDYNPAQLVLLGDLVHDAAGTAAFFSSSPGNHDRQTKHQTSNIRNSDLDLVESWRSDGFYFHHGDCRGRVVPIAFRSLDIITRLARCATVQACV